MNTTKKNREKEERRKKSDSPHCLVGNVERERGEQTKTKHKTQNTKQHPRKERRRRFALKKERENGGGDTEKREGQPTF